MSLKTEMAKGASWTVLLRFAVRGIGFASTLVLARLLVPADFGLVAMATSVIALVDMLGDFGFHVFLVQKENLTKEDLDTAWTVQLCIAAIQAALLALVAIPVARFYGDPRLPNIVWALSLAVFATGFKNIGTIFFLRDMRFHLDFCLRAASKFVGFVATVSMAFAWRSYWALVIGTVVHKMAEVLLSYALQPHRPKFRLAGSREIFHFSKWVYCNTTLMFFEKRSPDFVLGRLAGPGSLGLFSMGYDIAMLPTSEMAAPINRAAFPGYAKMRNDPDTLRDGYLSVLGMIAMVSLPAGLGIAGTAGLLTPLLLGEKWLEAVPIISILAFAGALESLQTNATPLFYSQGRPWTITWLSIVRIVLLLPCLILFAKANGAVGAATAYLAVSIAMKPVEFGAISSALKLRIRMIPSVILRPAISALAMYGALHFWLSPAAMSVSETWRLPGAIGLVLAGACLYVSCVLLLWLVSGRPANSAESVIVGLIKKQASKRFSPARLGFR